MEGESEFCLTVIDSKHFLINLTRVILLEAQINFYGIIYVYDESEHLP